MVLTKRDLARSWWGGGPGPKSKITENRTGNLGLRRGWSRLVEVGRGWSRLVEVSVEIGSSHQPARYSNCSRESTGKVPKLKLLKASYILLREIVTKSVTLNI